MQLSFDRILIIADIEGSSGCWSYRASSFLTREWSRACREMTKDVAAVVAALFAAGVRQVVVKDFHRTGYNLLPELIDRRAHIVSGYRREPVPGIGAVDGLQAVMLIGLHAASGTNGFLPHTLTSRLQKVEVNGKPIPEVAFFCASLAPYEIRPVFFSGCPLACRQAEEVIPNLSTYHIDKSNPQNDFDADSWRAGLARAATRSLNNCRTLPYHPSGPFDALITMRDGARMARKMARRWSFDCQGSQILIESADIHGLYDKLIRLCYLTPALEKYLPLALWIFNLKGRVGLAWVRRQLRKPQSCIKKMPKWHKRQ